MKNKLSPKDRLSLYKGLTSSIDGTDLFEAYANLKNKGVVKSPASFQEYIVYKAFNSIDDLIESQIKA